MEKVKEANTAEESILVAKENGCEISMDEAQML